MQLATLDIAFLMFSGLLALDGFIFVMFFGFLFFFAKNIDLNFTNSIHVINLIAIIIIAKNNNNNNYFC